MVDSFLGLLATLICEGIFRGGKKFNIDSMHVAPKSELHDKENFLVLAPLLDKLFNNIIKNVS